MNVLVLNCGSSSVKYSVWDTSREKRLVSGVIDSIRVAGATSKHIKNGSPLPEEIAVGDHAGAVAFVIEMLKKEGIGSLSAIGHRVVQGGDRFKEPALVTDEVKEAITHYFDIAPLHNPSNLEGIISCQKNYPSIPNVAVFDTAFHQSVPEIATTYAIPRYLAKKHGIKRYGFHGISHDYVSREVAARYPAAKKIISCHLGNGSSVTAIKDGKSLDTSMGFSPLEGLVMGTRPGDLDPEIPLYLMEKENFTPGELLAIFNKQSGLAGISGISSDMRKLLSSDDPDAKLAVDVFCYRVKKYIGSYFAALDGADALVFTAGIGENAPAVRAKITDGLDALGVKIEAAANDAARGTFADITAPAAGDAVKVLVVPTNEDLLIAREASSVAAVSAARKTI